MVVVDLIKTNPFSSGRFVVAGLALTVTKGPKNRLSDTHRQDMRSDRLVIGSEWEMITFFNLSFIRKSLANYRMLSS